jgi:hypothetical protein
VSDNPTSLQTIAKEENRKVNGVAAKAVVPYGFDGVGIVPQDSPALATQIIVSGSITYLGQAQPGTALGTAAWRARKIDQSTANTIITWADSGNFSQTATDLTALSYS